MLEAKPQLRGALLGTPAPTVYSDPRANESPAAARARQAEKDAEVAKYLERIPEVTHYSTAPAPAKEQSDR